MKEPQTLIDRVAAYACNRIRLSKWPMDILHAWLVWYQSHGLLTVIEDGRQNVIAFAAARPTTQECAADHNSIVWEGNVLAVDFFAADNPRARAALWRLMVDAIKPREWIAYCRNKYNDRPALFPFQHFARNVSKLPLSHG